MAQLGSLSQFGVPPAALEAAELSSCTSAQMCQARLVKYLSAFVAEADSHLAPPLPPAMPVTTTTRYEIAGSISLLTGATFLLSRGERKVTASLNKYALSLWLDSIQVTVHQVKTLLRISSMAVITPPQRGLADSF